MGGIDPTCHWVVHISQKFVSTPQMFGTNIRIEVKMLDFKHILEIFLYPPMFGTNLGIESKMFFTHPRNMFPTPKCLAQISGENSKFCFFTHPNIHAKHFGGGNIFLGCVKNPTFSLLS